MLPMQDKKTRHDPGVLPESEETLFNIISICKLPVQTLEQKMTHIPWQDVAACKRSVSCKAKAKLINIFHLLTELVI